MLRNKIFRANLFQIKRMCSKDDHHLKSSHKQTESLDVSELNKKHILEVLRFP